MRGHIFALSLLLLGVVDYVGGDYVTAEITTDKEIMTIVIPIEFFPCDIGEGDFFHFEHVDGVTEIRCGEPEA